MAFNRRAPGYDSTRENAGGLPDEGRRQHPCTFLDNGARLHPNSGPDLFSGGAGLGLQSENVNRQLAQVTRIFQEICVSLMSKLRAIAAALLQMAAEQ